MLPAGSQKDKVAQTIAGMIDPSKPTFTVESLVRYILAAMAADFGFPFGCIILVNQIDGNVILVVPTSAEDAASASAKLNALEPGNSDLVCLQLSQDSAVGTVSVKRIFEGGATIVSDEGGTRRPL